MIFPVSSTLLKNNCLARSVVKVPFHTVSTFDMMRVVSSKRQVVVNAYRRVIGSVLRIIPVI